MLTAEREKLPVNHRRYLADALIFELRLDDRWNKRWTRRRLPEAEALVRSQAPGEAPPFHAVGVGKETKPIGAIDVLEFKAEPLPELGIPRYLVALDEWSLTDYMMELETEGRLELFHSLLAMRPDAYVYTTAYNGYGTTQQPTMKLGAKVGTERAKIALELLERAQVWRM